MKVRFTIGAAVSILALSSCGGEDGSTSTPLPPAPTNAAPVFMSAGSAVVPENRTGAAYQASATDADGQSLTYTIVGGSDAGQFTITQAGALSFNAAPDFETPKDANADNVYEVNLSVSDGITTSTLPLRLSVEDQRYRVRQIATGFIDPLRVQSVGDGSGRLYVVERRGVVWIFDPATGAKASTPFLDLRDEVTTDGERGLLNVLVTQEKNNVNSVIYISVYVYMTDKSGDIVVRRYKTANPTDFERVSPTSMTEFFRVSHPSNRNLGGALGLYAVGLQGGPILVVGFGDADGTVANSRAQDAGTLLGKVVYGVVSSSSTGAPIAPLPNSTPILSLPYPYNLIQSFGARNPRYYDQQVITDQGLSFQELNRPSSPSDSNLGWPMFDGGSTGAGTLNIY